MAKHIEDLSQFLQSFGVAPLGLLFLPVLITALARNVISALATSLLSFASLMLFAAPASATNGLAIVSGLGSFLVALESVGLHRIERLLRLQALKARPRRRRLPPDLGERQATAVAANVLERSFDASAPNRKWIADFTYVWTAEGWLYVAAVIDLFSRRVVGWSMSAAMTAQLVTDALVMAIWRRGKSDALLHHSDRGSQYTSEQFQKLMADHGVVCSMSRSGNVSDNAAMERDRTRRAQNVPDPRRGES